jgi:ribonucleoside-diphosphate reductase beta chain
VVFGVKFLREMIQRDAAYARVVHDAVEKYAPTALAAIAPAPEQVQNILAAGDDPWMTPRYAEESLAKKLKVVGLSMKLPTLPLPPVMGM